MNVKSGPTYVAQPLHHFPYYLSDSVSQRYCSEICSAAGACFGGWIFNIFFFLIDKANAGGPSGTIPCHVSSGEGNQVYSFSITSLIGRHRGDELVVFDSDSSS